MFYSGLPICCGVMLERAGELLQVPHGPGDWVITKPIIAGATACATCGTRWLYSLNPKVVAAQQTELDFSQA